MCKKATCSICQKSTWWGCGNHVPSVMDSVADSERCTCEPKVTKEGKEYPPMG
ncbi:hypothetical protein BU16DRAFT_434206, partial [Lophium mytilinum]